MYFDVPKCSRICHETKRELQPDETFYSVVVEKGGEWVRFDYSEAAWKKLILKKPQSNFWWQSKIPSDKKQKQAPFDVLFELFDSLEGQPDKRETRYVLTLLLIRRRLFRLEDEKDNELIVFCPKRDLLYHVPIAVPTQEAENAIQETLGIGHRV